MPRLQQAVRALDADPDLRAASWAITVMDLRTRQVLLDRSGHLALSTASTMKVVSTAAALAVLGPEFRFRTRLEYDGTLEGGVLRGNLYIAGDGDPSLGSARFGEPNDAAHTMIAWAQAIQAAGIREIQGRVIADDQLYSTQLMPGTWNWEDLANYYGAGVSALNINENLFRLDLVPGARAGDPVRVLRTDPPLGMELVNELSTGAPGSGDQAYLFGAPYTPLRYVRGTIPAGVSSFSIKGTIPDPALHCAQRLTEELRSCGVQTGGEASSTRLLQAAQTLRSARRTVVYTWQSPPLSEIVFHTNQQSVNLFAEALGIRTARELGKPASPAGAVEALEQYWSSQGLDPRQLFWADASGLSAENAMSTSQLCALLAQAWHAPYAEAFKASLPVAGQSGTLKNLAAGTAAEGRVRAKSGYIGGVRAYAGYVTTQGGQELAFAMIANRFSCTPGEMARKFGVLMARMAEGQ
ncbi:MAG: D-alanyl-D-alanine carboxypeptidase/D-alanyl-D-alanine-endopeptidase [Bacteroidia bacterium]|nr:D-alanyl-D-alanine carboxypeptidase/D-alanyl-D-alanine-endopeptidase [Bacteroidia bacterium]